MRRQDSRMAVVRALVGLLALALGPGGVVGQEVKKPEPGVPEVFTLTGEFVRIAYNNEGYVTLGYRMANGSVGEEWILLEVGITLRENVKNQNLKRDALTISTPDGGSLPMASEEDYMKANLAALDMMTSKVVRDNINYFPPATRNPCRLGFFSDVSRTHQMPFDVVDLSYQRACVGRIYFHVPGGIQHGQHYLDVQFEKSLVRVPFRILTKDEEKKLKKTWPDIKKEHEKTFKQ